MSDDKTPPHNPADQRVHTGDPVGVMASATVGIITVLVRELVRTGALDSERFLRELDALAAMPLPVPQTPQETRTEQKAFQIVRMAAQVGQQEAS